MADLLVHFVAFFREHTKIRIVGIVVAFLLAWIAVLVPFSLLRYGLGGFVPTIFLSAVALGGACVLSFTDFGLRKSDTDLELERLRSEREEIRSRLSSDYAGSVGGHTAAEDIFGTIQLSLNQLTEYYTINKSQARNSFRFSVFAIVVGLATFIVGIVLYYSDKSHATHVSTITTIGGALVQFIGGAYFYLYRISLRQMNNYFEQLVSMQRTMLAIAVSEKLADSMKDQVREKLVWKIFDGATVPSTSAGGPP